ncbi:hypothetical protein [Reyranella sp.]|nr:hypothetical protein [Reyranella sp.]
MATAAAGARGLLVLRPANVGDPPNAYSFAMVYNRYGWSGSPSWR